MPQRTNSVYKTISESILAKIANGTYPIGSSLPPERILMEEYNVERTTIRRALSVLQDSGCIEKRAGLGSIILSDKASEAVPQKKPIPKALSETKSDIQTCVLPKESKCFCLILPEQAMAQNPTLQGVTNALRKTYENESTSFHVCVCSDKAELFEQLDRYKPNGVILCTLPNDSYLELLNRRTIPTVLAFCQANGFRCVLPDNDGGMRAILSKLRADGHTKIAFIGSDEKYFCERQRRISFEKALLDNGLPPDPALVNVGGNDESAGYDRFCELYYRSGGKFTAVCAANNELARGVLKAAQKKNISVPQELSVTGFGISDGKDNLTRALFDCEAFARELYFALVCEGKIPSSQTICVTVGTTLCGSTTEKLSEKSESQKRGMSDFLL